MDTDPLDCNLSICDVYHNAGRLVSMSVGFTCRWRVSELIAAWLSDRPVTSRRSRPDCRSVVDMLSRVSISAVCLARATFNRSRLAGLSSLSRTLLARHASLSPSSLVWRSAASASSKIAWILVRVTPVPTVSSLLR